MKKFISTSLLLGLASISPAYAYNDFINGGFENNSFAGWVSGGGLLNGVTGLEPADFLLNGSHYNSGAFDPTPMSYTDYYGNVYNYIEPANSYKGIVNRSSIDNNVNPTGGLVFNGNYAAQINNEYPDAGASAISQSVINYGGTSINFAWLAVFQQSGHEEAATPNFIIQVTDNTRGIVIGRVAYNEVSGQAALFSNTNGYISSGWQSTSIVVAKGHNYTLSLLAADCLYGGHAGYVFFDSFGSTVITEDEVGNPVTPLVIYFGPSQQDTNTSLQLAAYQLRSAYNSQVAASNLSLTHDCNLFDVKGLCISAGGRYTAIDNPTTNASAAVVTLGYKVNQNIRIGGFMDQNINIHTPGSINVANKNPLMGLYAVWNKETSGLGYQVRLANTYQDKDVTTSRTAIGFTSEPGSGTAKLNSQSYLAELSYAFQYQDKALVRPYFGLRYTRLKRDAYKEGLADDVSAPLSFDSLSDRSTTALLGARVNYQATPKTTLTANLGIEQDVYHKVDSLTATNTDIGELNAVAFNSNIKRTRPVASAGAYYDVTKAQRLSGTVTYQQLPFQATGATSLYVNYMIGF